MKDTDIRIREAEAHFTNERARKPLWTGSSVVSEAACCHVRVRVENGKGAVEDGWGAALLADFWPRPSMVAEHAGQAAVRCFVERLCAEAADNNEWGHPIDLFVELERRLDPLATVAARDCRLAVGLPYHAALVASAPVDAALHDAFGKVNGISTYEGYGPGYMDHDLAYYLGSEFKGRWLDGFIRPAMLPELPVFHVVGDHDRLRAAPEPPDEPHDGLPESLDRWIEWGNLTCLKLELRGTDLDWDVNRLLETYAVARETQAALGRNELYLSVGSSNPCGPPDYMIEMLEKVREASPEAHERILYIEQPAEQDIHACHHDMRPLSRIKPILIDESLITMDDFDLAVEWGWSGIALKSCWGQSMALLFVAKCEAMGLSYTFQDVTNPGLSLLHSTGLAARLKSLNGFEANGWPDFPAASGPERAAHPEVFHVRDGKVRTGSLGGSGLGYRMERIQRPIFLESKPAGV